MTHQPQVFISYQRNDEGFARQIHACLVTHGVRTWIDQHDIPVGAYWPDEIDKGLAASDIVVGILSPDSVESRNVKNEWDWAIQNGRRLILMQVAPCLIPHRYVSINFIDATAADPSPALAALIHSIGVAVPAAGDTPAAPHAVAAAVVRHAAQGPRPASRLQPFIAGREREQASLRGQLDRLMAGQGSLVLVGGEAGIGKTTLTTWLAGEAESRGVVVLSGGCYDLTTTPPYGPWSEIVRNWPGNRGLPPVPDALWGGEAMARLQSQAALFELVADLLATAGMVRPLVLILEDLHWADQPTLDLLRYLSRLVAGFRIMLVTTYRDDEITRRHPLIQILPVLAREPGAERVSLQRLGQDALRDIVASRYAVVATERERLVDHVHRASEGNPFFAGEVLRALEESRAIVHDGATWSLGDLERVAVPDLVRHVVEGRLAHLGDDVHRLLQVAAVIGHEVPIDLWVEVSAEDESMLSETLDRATEARIVEELPRSDGFRFTHALIRETLYEGLGLLRRRTLHRKTGEALARGLRPDPDSVAHQFSQAGDPRAFDWLIQAAERANRSYAWLIASERYEQAAAIIADDPGRVRQYGWLLTDIAQMLRYGEMPRAIRYMEEASRVGLAIGDAWLALLPLHDAAYYQSVHADIRTGINRMIAVGREMEQAFRDGRLLSWEPVTPDQVSWRSVFDYTHRLASERPNQVVALSNSLTSVHLARVGRFREAQDLTQQLATVWPLDVQQTQHVTLSGYWHNMWADLYYARQFIAFAMGHPDDALEQADVALRMYESTSHHFVISMLHRNVLWTLLAYRTDDLGRRRSVADDAATAWYRAHGAYPTGMPAHIWEIPLLILEGEWGQARDVAQHLSNRAVTGTHLEREVASQLAGLYLDQGRYAEAWQIVDHHLPDGTATAPGNHEFFAAIRLHDVAGGLALQADDRRCAQDWLTARDRWLDWSGAAIGQVDGHLGWARYYRQSGDSAAARTQAEMALAKAFEPRQPLGLIASHRLLGELATERGDCDAASGHLAAALTLADACAAPYERALTLIALAALDIAIGADAGENLAEARAICERLGAQPALERIAAFEQRMSDPRCSASDSCVIQDRGADI